MCLPDEMKESSLQLQKSSVELDELRGRCFEAQQLAKERGDMVSDLQGKVSLVLKGCRLQPVRLLCVALWLTSSLHVHHPPSTHTALSAKCKSPEKGLAERLAGKAGITSGLHLRRCEVFRSLRHYCWHKAEGITPSVSRRREA